MVPSPRVNGKECDSRTARAAAHALEDFPYEEFNYLFRNGQWEVSEGLEWEPLNLAVIINRMTQ